LIERKNTTITGKIAYNISPVSPESAPSPQPHQPRTTQRNADATRQTSARCGSKSAAAQRSQAHAYATRLGGNKRLKHFLL
jgi:hypothetical protein